MRKLLSIIAFLSVSSFAGSMKFNPNAIRSIDTINVTINSWDLLIYKIMKYETANFTDFEGDGGKAIGWMHNWKIYVDDVNQIQDSVHYSYEDRMDSLKCIDMFNIYQDYWNPTHDVELALRIHNSGPKGRFEQYAYLTDNYLNKFEL